ncbi:MarR family winged helix-turn-helix transcriptional regulator [Streptomyces sp. NPDC005728]|uniref:MarR family winged helix-turn-helix transcriptional regulator n=1 Tax=Streptomyces sp. NPDC005728 TaxID=3157054 RepID=UPI0033FB8861
MTAAETAVETIQREMTIFARRARASAGRMHPELSLVSYTLLGHLEECGGCRATDLAAHYALDKSTVSRQVAALERAGLIERRLDAEDHRVQVLHLTEAGQEILAQVTRSRGGGRPGGGARRGRCPTTRTHNPKKNNT